MVIRLNGHITDKGELKLDLPADLPAGEVQITIEIPADVQLTPKKAAQTLTEARRVAWRVPSTGPDPAHWLVIFKKAGRGKILYHTLQPGQVFKRPFLASADSFEAYAISADENLRHEFSRKYLSGAQTWSFTLHFKLHFRVEDAERLGLSLADRDPLERLEEEVASVSGATARRFSRESMQGEGEGFGLRLREAETMDGKGESRTNFRRLQDFASSLGLELRHLDILCSLTESDLKAEFRVSKRRRLTARSDQELAAEQEQLNHELQTLRDLRSVLDSIAEGRVQTIHQSAGELRSFDAIHRALTEIQGIQASLAGLSGEEVHAFTPGGYKDGGEVSDSGDKFKDLDRALQTKPMTGAEIVKAGLVGGWEDAGIDDSTHWIEEQRKARRERRRR